LELESSDSGAGCVLASIVMQDVHYGCSLSSRSSSDVARDIEFIFSGEDLRDLKGSVAGNARLRDSDHASR
jgi:hypothetical protein